MRGVRETARRTTMHSFLRVASRGGIGAGLLRLEAGGDSGTSVERFAASSVAAGVSVGCAGGGCRLLIMDLREPQPEKQIQRTQTIQNSRRKNETQRTGCGLPQSLKGKAGFARSGRKGIGPFEPQSPLAS
jgi:hypothetical protein